MVEGQWWAICGLLSRQVPFAKTYGTASHYQLRHVCFQIL